MLSFTIPGILLETERTFESKFFFLFVLFFFLNRQNIHIRTVFFPTYLLFLKWLQSQTVDFSTKTNKPSAGRLLHRTSVWHNWQQPEARRQSRHEREMQKLLEHYQHSRLQHRQHKSLIKTIFPCPHPIECGPQASTDWGDTCSTFRELGLKEAHPGQVSSRHPQTTPGQDTQAEALIASNSIRASNSIKFPESLSDLSVPTHTQFLDRRGRNQ